MSKTPWQRLNQSYRKAAVGANRPAHWRKTMKAYLIDPYARAVTEIETTGRFADLYPVIECSTIEIVRLERDDVLIDEEGTFSFQRPDGTEKALFKIKGFPTPLVGFGVVLGHTPDGDSAPPKMRIEEVRARVTFLSLEQVRRQTRPAKPQGLNVSNSPTPWSDVAAPVTKDLIAFLEKREEQPGRIGREARVRKAIVPAMMLGACAEIDKQMFQSRSTAHAWAAVVSSVVDAVGEGLRSVVLSSTRGNEDMAHMILADAARALAEHLSRPFDAKDDESFVSNGYAERRKQ